MIKKVSLIARFFIILLVLIGGVLIWVGEAKGVVRPATDDEFTEYINTTVKYNPGDVCSTNSASRAYDNNCAACPNNTIIGSTNYSFGCKQQTPSLQCVYDNNKFVGCGTDQDLLASKVEIGIDNTCLFNTKDPSLNKRENCVIDCKKEVKEDNNVGCKADYTCAYSSSSVFSVNTLKGCVPFGNNEGYKGAKGYSSNYCNASSYFNPNNDAASFTYGDYYYQAACDDDSQCIKYDNRVNRCVDQEDACGNGRGLQKDNNPTKTENFQYCPNTNQCKYYKTDVLDEDGNETEAFTFYYFDNPSDPNAKPKTIYCPSYTFNEQECQYNRVSVDEALPNLNSDNLYPVFDGCDSGGVSGWLWGKFNNTLGRLITFILGVIVRIFGMIMGLILTMVFAGLDWILGLQSMDNTTVNIVWLYMRDIANLGFVAALLYIAFATILRIQSATMRRLLPKFVLAVILVNFSKLIAFTVVDIAQFFINSFAGMVLSGGSMKSAFNIMSYISEASGANTFGGAISGTNSVIDFASISGALVFGLIMQFLMVVVFGIAVVLLIIRLITIWLLVAISPLMYLAMAFGQNQWVDRWWKMFLAAAFFGPVMLFCLVMAIIVLSQPVPDLIKSSSDVMKVSADLNKAAAPGAPNLNFEKFIQMLFALTFVIVGLKAAKSSSMAGASTVTAWGNKAIAKGKAIGMRYGVKEPGKITGKFAKRQTLDRATNKLMGTKFGRATDKLTGYRLSERRAKKQTKKIEEYSKIKDPRRRRAILDSPWETGLKGQEGRFNKLAMLQVMAKEGDLLDKDKKYVQMLGSMEGSGTALTEVAKAMPHWLSDKNDQGQADNLRKYVDNQMILRLGENGQAKFAEQVEKAKEDEGENFNMDNYMIKRRLDWAASKFKPSDAGNLSAVALDRILFDTTKDEQGNSTKRTNLGRAQAFMSKMSPSHLSNIATTNPSNIAMVQRSLEDINNHYEGGISEMEGFGYDQDGNFGWKKSPNGERIEKYIAGVYAQQLGYRRLEKKSSSGDNSKTTENEAGGNQTAPTQNNPNSND